MKKKAIVLVSGGVDSSTILAILAKEEYEIYAISFNYGQKQAIELQKITEFLKNYKVKEHKIINLDLKSFGGSALTDSNIQVPNYQTAEEVADTIPLSYVPARNTIFLSYALAFAEVKDIHDIFIGVHATDHSNYPDCRPEFIAAFEKLANVATASGVNGKTIKIHAPLMNLTKTGIVKLGMELGVDYSLTISCYDPRENAVSCGKCLACLVRMNAFAENNLVDPIKYL